jgi:general L-amino acid transport system permease protein
MTTDSPRPTYRRWWPGAARPLERPAHRQSHRWFITQTIILIGSGLAAWFIIATVAENLAARGIASGFHFLFHEAGFEISETIFLSYSPADAYLKAFYVGVLNTLRAAALGIVIATPVGTLIGLARLSRNWLLAKIAAVYVEVVRNVPLLVQLFFWYTIITEYLPTPADAFNPVPGVFISNRGVAFPALGSAFELEYPELTGFNFFGGGALSPEFVALLIGLVVYSASFIAEIVRAGVLAVEVGQFEAAQALGLTAWQRTRFVILPQALRLIVPPLTSQYLNITKNSSLAVAIGYPDLVSIANTVINQTGQAIEGIAVIMLVYLTISLALSVFMNWYNRLLRRKGRP